MRAKVLIYAGVAVWIVTLTLAAAGTSDASGRGDDESRIQQGFEIAPVHLNLHGKNRALVGLGSYLVNAVGDCNGCHHATLSPSSPFAPGFDPFQGQPKKIEQA